MNRQDIEAMCRKAGLPPAHKDTIHGVEILVADGYVSPSNMHKLQKFGIEKDDYPMGCYATIWWAMKTEEKFAIAKPLFFEWNHDSDYGQDGKKRGRINAAMQDAHELLQHAEKVVMHG